MSLSPPCQCSQPSSHQRRRQDPLQISWGDVELGAALILPACSQQQKDPALPCPAGDGSFHPQFLPAVLGGAARAVLTLAGPEPFPQHTAPWGAGTLIAKTALGPPGCTPGFTPCSCSQKAAAIMPFPSNGAAGNPCFAAHPPPLHQSISESCTYRSHATCDVPALGDPTRICRCNALQPRT